MYSTLSILLLLPLVIQSSGHIPRITFNNGKAIPIVGLGTYKSKPNEVTQAVKDAIDVGYRHIDCAPFYENEKEVGEAIAAKIAEGVVKREDLFITSKLWNSDHNPARVEPALRKTLKDLGLEYLDLYLIHFPMGFTENNLEFSDDDYVDTWLAMEKIYAKGLAKSIGISNFNKKQIERVLERASIIPVTNQVECHPYLNQAKLISFCKSKNITVTAYSPLSQASAPSSSVPTLLENPKIKQIADRLHKTPAQVSIRYQIDRGIIVIPKSVKKHRIVENYQVFDFKLTAKDVSEINDLNINGRVVTIPQLATHKYYPFKDEY